MTYLESVVTEYNARRRSSTPAIDANAMTTSDAADIFNYMDSMLVSFGYVQGESHLCTTEDQAEQERYLAATLSLLESGFNTPMGTVSF